MSSKDMNIQGIDKARIVKALANEVRLKILNLLSHDDMNIQRLADELRLSKATVMTHVNILEDSGFIKTRYISGTIGNQRICHKLYDRLIFNFTASQIDNDNMTFYEQSIKVGNYFDFAVYPPCGLIRANSIIHKWDDPLVFSFADRVEAVLVWAAHGFLEYKVPVEPLFDNRKVKAVIVQMEASAHGYLSEHEALKLPEGVNRDDLTDGISDLTFWINGTEIGTYTVHAGQDRKKAIYTPIWWQTYSFLHGEAIKLAIKDNGCYIQGHKTNDLSFSEIVGDKNILNLRIGVKDDAKHKAGLAILGSKFGRYNHDILVKTYSE